MVAIDKAVVAKINKNGKEFEILVDPDKAQKAKEQLKKGDIDISDILAIEDVFVDYKKGERAGKKDLLPVFDTADIMEVAKIILRDGKLHTTSQQRTKEQQDKWDKIVATIAMNAIDSKTRLPIPQKTINDALHKAAFRIDERKMEDQMPDAIKKLKAAIPFTFNERIIELKNIEPHFARPCLDLCKRMGSIKTQSWNADKSLSMVVVIPAGLREELIDKLNDLTRGKIDLKLID